MAKYIKKPIPIEIEPYKPGMEDGYKVLVENYELFVAKDLLDIKTFEKILCPAIQTLEGWMEISESDYIVIGIDGERYPIKKSILDKTYDKVK